MQSVICSTFLQDCTPLREGHLLALPVGVESLEEGQSAFYNPQGTANGDYPLPIPNGTLPGGLLSGETHGGSQDPCKRGIWRDKCLVSADDIVSDSTSVSPYEVQYCQAVGKCTSTWPDEALLNLS